MTIRWCGWHLSKLSQVYRKLNKTWWPRGKISLRDTSRLRATDNRSLTLQLAEKKRSPCDLDTRDSSDFLEKRSVCRVEMRRICQSLFFRHVRLNYFAKLVQNKHLSLISVCPLNWHCGGSGSGGVGRNNVYTYIPALLKSSL